eukprot:s1629_g34.t2
MREAFAQNFPPLSRSRSSHAGANRGHDTADRGASRALQIERARVRTAERAAAVARLKEDLARLYRDTTAFRAEEVRLKTQAESETWRGGQQREAQPGLRLPCVPRGIGIRRLARLIIAHLLREEPRGQCLAQAQELTSCCRLWCYQAYRTVWCYQESEQTKYCRHLKTVQW